MKTCIYPVGLILFFAMAMAAQHRSRLPESGPATSQPDPFDIVFKSMDDYMNHDMAYEDRGAGRRSEAVKQLEEYLRRAPEADPARSQIEARLAQLGYSVSRNEKSCMAAQIVMLKNLTPNQCFSHQ